MFTLIVFINVSTETLIRFIKEDRTELTIESQELIRIICKPEYTYLSSSCLYLCLNDKHTHEQTYKRIISNYVGLI